MGEDGIHFTTFEKDPRALWQGGHFLEQNQHSLREKSAPSFLKKKGQDAKTRLPRRERGPSLKGGNEFPFPPKEGGAQAFHRVAPPPPPERDFPPPTGRKTQTSQTPPFVGHLLFFFSFRPTIKDFGSLSFLPDQSPRGTPPKGSILIRDGLFTKRRSPPCRFFQGW